jgi:hypothetical protein
MIDNTVVIVEENHLSTSSTKSTIHGTGVQTPVSPSGMDTAAAVDGDFDEFKSYAVPVDAPPAEGQLLTESDIEAQMLLAEKDTFDREQDEWFELQEQETKRYGQTVEQAKDYAVEFPTQAMHGSLADLAHALLDGSEVPVEFGFMSAVTAFGLICAERLRLANDDLETFPNLYTVLVAPTGGKKSTAVRKIVDFFSDMGLTQNLQDYQSALVFPKAGSGEGLLKLFKPAVKEGNQWVTHDRHRVLLTPDEFQELLHKCRTENSTLAPELTSLFDGTSAGNITKDKAINVTDGHLSIIGCITTKLWDETWSQGSERSLGLLNRLFIVSSLPRPKVFMPPVADAEKLKLIKERIRQQISRHQRIPITEDGLVEFRKFYLKLDQNLEESTRIETIAKKLALVLAVTNDKATINSSIARMAIRLAEYQVIVRQRLNPSEAQNVIAKSENRLRDYLQRHPQESFTAARIADRTTLKHTVGMNIVIQALRGLVAGGEIQFNPLSNRYSWFGDVAAPKEAEHV